MAYTLLTFAVFCLVYAEALDTDRVRCTDAQTAECNSGECEIINVNTNEFKCNCDRGYYEQFCTSTVDHSNGTYIPAHTSLMQFEIITNVVGYGVYGCILLLFIVTTVCAVYRCKYIAEEETVDGTLTPMLATMVSVTSRSSESRPLPVSIELVNEESR